MAKGIVAFFFNDPRTPLHTEIKQVKLSIRK
jgi:hypothetical protein